MKHLLSSPKLRELIRFGIVGCFAAALHYAVYLLLLRTNMNETIAFSIGYAISWCFNFLLSNYFTFKTKPSIKNGIGFALTHLINYLLQVGFLQLYLYLGVNELYAPIPVYASAIPINFLLVRFVLKKGGKKGKEWHADETDLTD